MLASTTLTNIGALFIREAYSAPLVSRVAGNVIQKHALNQERERLNSIAEVLSCFAPRRSALSVYARGIEAQSAF